MSKDATGIEGLTGFQRDLLIEIAEHENPPSGQDIRRSIQDRMEHKVNHGRLYPNLDALVDQELVLKGTIDRRTNNYQLTADGAEIIKGRRNRLDKINVEPHVASEESTEHSTLTDGGEN